MFVERAPLQRREVEGDGIGLVGVLSEKIMATKMIFR